MDVLSTVPGAARPSLLRAAELVVDASFVGKQVVDANGDDVGTLKEVHGGYFKVDVPMARDYWLSAAYVAPSSAGEVRLTLAKGAIDEHKLDEPGLEPESDPESAAQVDRILTPEAALSQRERMERELEEQRRRMTTGPG